MNNQHLDTAALIAHTIIKLIKSENCVNISEWKLHNAMIIYGVGARQAEHIMCVVYTIRAAIVTFKLYRNKPIAYKKYLIGNKFVSNAIIKLQNWLIAFLKFFVW